MSYWVPSGFLPQSKDMHEVGVNANSCLSLCGPAINRPLVHGVALPSPCDSWLTLQQTPTILSAKQMQIRTGHVLGVSINILQISSMKRKLYCIYLFLFFFININMLKLSLTVVIFAREKNTISFALQSHGETYDLVWIFMLVFANTAHISILNSRNTSYTKQSGIYL